MSGTYNTSAVQGERWYRRFRYLDDNDQPIDISSYSARMQIRTHDKGPLVAQAICSIEGPAGAINVEVTHAATLAMDARQYYYDLWLDDIPISRGAFDIIPGMTKPEVA